ncbi:fimbrial biogenesis chaperone [Pseudoxanthomonas kaohsiungensis]|uniref:Molecular chaperone n=1 Tax=Pseudoxanthomonas kaohsiungensis TaxID=283923 RepID=A0ABW3LT26_9GAMM|nr:fimbria/pilus periplasmic chaperone [Pseudoxanthomonas kaohsiungensis]KAF1700707.1 pili assembly chaperone [Pseudoxanthomonas kaohsiungensis]
MIRGRATLRLFTLAIWLAAATPATSGDLRLEPVSLTLGPGEEATSLWLSNTGRQPLQAQVRLFSWTQDGGGEVLQATRELAVSPPLLEVPPLGRQRVRVVRLAGSTISAETAYRLVVDELPPDSPPAAGGQASLLRYSIPVFIQPSAAAKPRLSARIDEDAAGNRLLRLQNSGDRHARVAALAYIGTGERRHALAPNLAGYVLAGRYKHWPLPADAGRPPYGRFEADVDGEPVVLVPEADLLTGR